jgi:predicted RNase H-related nuclease YkuK (DUF458 family)
MTEIEYRNDIRYMKRYGTKKWVNVDEFIKEQMAKNPDLTVHIGTDSQYSNGISHYVTVVALRYGKRGVIGLYNPSKFDVNGKPVEYVGRRRKRHRGGNSNGTKDKDIEAITRRLRKETELTMEIAYYLHSTCQIPIESIDLDYNKDDGGTTKENVRGSSTKKEIPVNLSNKVINDMKGWALGSGIAAKVKVKPEELIATPFADKLCRKY